MSALLGISSLTAMSGGVQVDLDGNPGYYNYYDGPYDNTVIWYGPGWYWGNYYYNEDDFYAYHRRYGHWPHHWHNRGHGGHWHGRHGGHHGGGGHHR